MADLDRAAALVAILTAAFERAAAVERDWFAAALAASRDPHDPSRFLASYSATGRRLRSPTPCLTRDDVAALQRHGMPESITRDARGIDGVPRLDRLVRVALLCEAVGAADRDADVRTAAGAQADRAVALVEAVFRGGDNEERIALLRALPLLRDPARFVATATGACRTNVIPVFEAIALRNSYPADHFGDDAFNQMVLKALFLGVAVTGIDGLRRRFNRELARMVEAYASERRAAGRAVPDDVAVIAAMGAPS